MLIKVSMINSVLLKILRFLTPAAPRAEWSTWSPATAAIKIASIVLSIPGCETLNCSAIAIIAAPTIKTSTQERWYSPHCTKVALGSGKMSFPATNRTRIYTKPGKYLSRLLLSAPRTCAAVVALLARGPSYLQRFLPLSPPTSKWAGTLWGNGGMLGHSFQRE